MKYESIRPLNWLIAGLLKHANLGERTTLCGDNTALLKGPEQKLKVWLLEKALGGSLWVRGVSDNDVELVLVVLEELESISHMDLNLRVLVADSHSREVLL